MAGIVARRRRALFADYPDRAEELGLPVSDRGQSSRSGTRSLPGCDASRGEGESRCTLGAMPRRHGPDRRKARRAAGASRAGFCRFHRFTTRDTRNTKTARDDLPAIHKPPSLLGALIHIGILPRIVLTAALPSAGIFERCWADAIDEGVIRWTSNRTLLTAAAAPPRWAGAQQSSQLPRSGYSVGVHDGNIMLLSRRCMVSDSI
jgi:hypothetical protein